jgi:mono/diheme cytochrome c family protein
VVAARDYSCAALCVAALSFVFSANVGTAADAPRTVLDGVYSPAQMTRGRNMYGRHCKGCHLDNLLGDGVDPPLTSSLFIDAWREDYLASLFDFVSTRMPRGRNVVPGSLKTQEYLDIVAYILSYNEYPAGTTDLKLEDLSAVMLVGTDGPAPLPPSAMMRTVGCFEAVDDGWRLLQAATPARVRDPDETSPTEVARSAQLPEGTLEFRLNNVDQLKDIEPAKAANRRVQIKGVLNGTGDTARIYVLSLADTGQPCG